MTLFSSSIVALIIVFAFGYTTVTKDVCIFFLYSRFVCSRHSHAFSISGMMHVYRLICNLNKFCSECVEHAHLLYFERSYSTRPITRQKPTETRWVSTTTHSLTRHLLLSIFENPSMKYDNSNPVAYLYIPFVAIDKSF